MKKTAVVYDKWLSTLGGGEVVACHMARILKDIGYDVVFVCGKKVPPKEIKNKLNIDLSDLKFQEVWNDEIKLKKIVSGKDLFINCSFMDYSFGYAKRNIYYTLFPTEAYTNLKGKIFNELILPFASKIVKPVEFITEKNETLIHKHYGFILKENNKLAFSNLKVTKAYLLTFRIFFENFYKNLLENFSIKIDNGKTLNTEVKIDHHHNVIAFNLLFKPFSNSIYLNLKLKKTNKNNHSLKNNIILISPKVIDINFPNFIYKIVYEKIQARLRAGIFINILERLKSYQIILADSEFTKKWIKIYWKRESEVLYPPVDLLFEKYDLSKIKKENWICNVGRFFTLGHGKKQEILVEAFKKFYDQGYKDWQLHLVGGIGNESSSQKFAQYLKNRAKGYPIFFHFNAPRSKVEEILIKSKIYWHATGYGENENKHPIKFEHFGIAPIEAISAGCVPILFKGGGLVEIIKKINYQKNFIFNSTSDLINKTKEILNQNTNLNYRKTEIFSLLNFKNFFKKHVF